MSQTVDADVWGPAAALSDADRAHALQASGLLTAHGDPAMDRLARLAAALVDAPRAFVTMVTPEAQHLPGMVRHDDPADTSRQTPLADSFCQFAVATEEPLVIPDSVTDLLVRDMDVVRRGEIGAYAGMPLRTNRGQVLGTLCVVDSEPRSWSPQRLGLLEDLTALAAGVLDERLGQAADGGLRPLAQQVTEQVPPLGDAVHSLVELAEQEEDPVLRRYAALGRARLEPVVTLARRLRQVLEEPSAGQDARSADPVDLRSVAGRCIRAARAVTGTAALHLQLPDTQVLVPCDPVGLERALTHAVVTALHRAAEEASLSLRVESSGPAADGGGPHNGRGTATIVLHADRCRVPSGELARLVARFAAASCPDPDRRPASLRVARGTVVAEAGAVRAETAPDGGFTLVARWDAADPVSRTGPR